MKNNERQGQKWPRLFIGQRFMGRLYLLLKPPAAREALPSGRTCGVFKAELRRSQTRLRSDKLRGIRAKANKALSKVIHPWPTALSLALLLSLFSTYHFLTLSCSSTLGPFMIAPSGQLPFLVVFQVALLREPPTLYKASIK
jgi:hypothetical protein